MPLNGPEYGLSHCPVLKKRDRWDTPCPIRLGQWDSLWDTHRKTADFCRFGGVPAGTLRGTPLGQQFMISLQQLAQATDRKSPKETEMLRSRLVTWLKSDPPLIREIPNTGRNKRYDARDLGVIALADRLTDLGLGTDAIHAFTADRARFNRFYTYAAKCVCYEPPPAYPVRARLALFRIPNSQPELWGVAFEQESAKAGTFEREVAELSCEKDEVLIFDLSRLLQPYRGLIVMMRDQGRC